MIIILNIKFQYHHLNIMSILLLFITIYLDNKMGNNCNFKSDQEDDLKSYSKYKTLLLAISRNSFHLHYIIGKGGFGQVD